jgi:CRP/FNR family cyclic AMP-dependent transcriptional regulator
MNRNAEMQARKAAGQDSAQPNAEPGGAGQSGLQAKDTPATPTADERMLALGLAVVCQGDQLQGVLGPMLAATPLFCDLSLDQIERVSAVMTVYDAPVGVTLITEGDQGDFMLLLLTGAVDVLRRNRNSYPARIAVVEPGQSLGEMSMFDGEPRFSSCVTIEPSRIAVLEHKPLMQLFDADPSLGNRVMLQLVRLLSDRLRQTGAQLVSFLDSARGV